MDRYRAIKEFRRLDPGIPVIAMSGVMFHESSQRHAPDFLGMAARLGATRTLNKPFKPAELMEAVGACSDARVHFEVRTRSAAG
jgi:two-component system, response regulator, stage 0 sporulation protein F